MHRVPLQSQRSYLVRAALHRHTSSKLIPGAHRSHLVVENAVDRVSGHSQVAKAIRAEGLRRSSHIRRLGSRGQRIALQHGASGDLQLPPLTLLLRGLRKRLPKRRQQQMHSQWQQKSFVLIAVHFAVDHDTFAPSPIHHNRGARPMLVPPVFRKASLARLARIRLRLELQRKVKRRCSRPFQHQPVSNCNQFRRQTVAGLVGRHRSPAWLRLRCTQHKHTANNSRQSSQPC